MLSGLPRTQGVPLPRGKSSPGRSQSTVHSEIFSHKGNRVPIQSLSCLLLNGIPILSLAYHPTLPDLALGKYFPFPDDAKCPSREPPLFLQVPLLSFLSTLLPLCSLVESRIQPCPLPSKVTPKVQISLCSHPLPHSPLLPEFSLGFSFGSSWSCHLQVWGMFPVSSARHGESQISASLFCYSTVSVLSGSLPVCRDR